ncbi:MAG: TonB-dependent receptor plug domain-containing protein [Gemmatimonadaceae bacterium]
MLLRTFAPIALTAVLPMLSLAQGVARDTARTAPIVVTATRSALTAERAPASVSVITGEQLRRQGVTSVADALREVPGLTLAQTGSYGASTSLFIRGGESKYTKVLVDGIPVNEAGGAFDFSSLTTDNIDRIEIVRGPTSVLYGSDAMAGVVQLFTRPGAARATTELSARGGRFGTFDAEGTLRGSSSALTYSVGGGHHVTDGFQAFNSRNVNDVGSALVGAQHGAADARLALRVTDVAFHYPTDGSGQVVDSNAVHREDRVALGVDAGYRFTPSAEVRLALASNSAHGVSDNQPDSPGDVNGYYFTTAERSHRRSGDLRLQLTLPAASQLTLGGQVERSWQESGTTSNFGDTPPYSHVRRTTGGYAQLLVTPAPFTAAFGARYEHNEQFGDFATYRVAGTAQVSSATHVRASFGTAFREPTFLESYGGGFVNGNPALAPEQAFSVDVGVEQRLGDHGTLGATYFNNSFRNMIDYRYAQTGPDYFNLARTRTSGLELEGRIELLAGFHADAAFTYLDTKVVDPGASTAPTALFVPGAHLLRRPMHTLDVGVGYRAEQGGLDVRARRVGTREDNYYAPDFSASHVTLPAYTRVDLSGELALTPASMRRGRATATLRVENLFDARYTDVAGFNYDFRLTDESSLRQTGYRAAGRRALVGVRLSY